MSKKNDRIEHQGIVEEAKDGLVVVNILQTSACVSCAVKGACNVSETENKLIEIRNFTEQYERGERVTVFYERALGFKALFWGYVLPFLILLTVLLAVSGITNDEGIAGLSALVSLVPYYTALYLMRDRMKKEFAFRIEKTKESLLLTPLG